MSDAEDIWLGQCLANFDKEMSWSSLDHHSEGKLSFNWITTPPEDLY